ncbi:cytochrome c [Photobacterium sp. SDRW27]|uniref:c-type cytochrome n=1 Tax=Photobacterium obscurum TaxID=2829490 RepID=UPI002244E7BA|nr:cytochrome c [Photobacterium obscurum]MCW8330958.1 cytochrome c [Photobacterium obscurum]
MRTPLVALLICLPSISFAQNYEQQIQYRQNAFSAIEKQAKVTNKALDKSQPDWLLIESNSQELAQHAQNLTTLFPQGSEEGSKAKTAVWNKPEKFNQLLAQMEQGFQALYQASNHQDVSAALAGLEQAQATCKSCHRSYRSRW